MRPAFDGEKDKERGVIEALKMVAVEVFGECHVLRSPVAGRLELVARIQRFPPAEFPRPGPDCWIGFASKRKKF